MYLSMIHVQEQIVSVSVIIPVLLIALIHVLLIAQIFAAGISLFNKSAIKKIPMTNNL